MISIEAIVISAPEGLFKGTPTGQALDFTGAALRTVGPVFERMLSDVKERTDNPAIAAGWQDPTPQADPSGVTFSSVNTNPVANIYYGGSAPHDIPQPPHFVPIGKLTAFYAGTRGLDATEARAAAGGFAAWGSRNEWTIKHPGTRPHPELQDTWDAYQGPFWEAAQEAFAQSVSARFA